MDSTYAQGRRASPALQYRYRARALEVAQAVRRCGLGGRALQVLDLGAADGQTMVEMARLLPSGSHFLGVEYSAALVSFGKGLGESIELVQGDIQNLPAPVRQRSFDVVTATAVLEHLADPLTAIQGAAAVLSSGGIFVATFPAPGWDKLATRLRLLEDHHESHLSLRATAEVVRSAGLRVLDMRRFMWAPVAYLPYLGIRVAPTISFAVDRVVRWLRAFEWQFINQLLVATKP